MYGWESWTIKKAEHWRIDAFKLLCWRRLLRVPWTARRSSQSILKEINHKYSLEGLMLKLKLQYFVHLMGRTDSLEKTLMLGKIEGKRRRKQQRMIMVGWNHWLNGHEFRQTLGDSRGQGRLVCCSPWDGKELDLTEGLNINNNTSSCFLAQFWCLSPWWSPPLILNVLFTGTYYTFLEVLFYIEFLVNLNYWVINYSLQNWL